MTAITGPDLAAWLRTPYEPGSDLDALATAAVEAVAAILATTTSTPPEATVRLAQLVTGGDLYELRNAPHGVRALADGSGLRVSRDATRTARTLLASWTGPSCL